MRNAVIKIEKPCRIWYVFSRIKKLTEEDIIMRITTAEKIERGELFRFDVGIIRRKKMMGILEK